MAIDIKLKITSGKHAGREVPVQTPVFVIGRDEGCHLRPGSDMVSRRHAQLHVDAEGLRLEDLKSSNGTLLNGQRISGEHRLKSGDRVKIGPLEFEVVFVKPGSATTVALPKSTVEKVASRIPPPPESDIMRYLAEAPGQKSASKIYVPDPVPPGLAQGDTAPIKLDGTQADIWPSFGAESAAPAPTIPPADTSKIKKGKQPDPNDAASSRDAAMAAIDLFRNRKK